MNLDLAIYVATTDWIEADVYNATCRASHDANQQCATPWDDRLAILRTTLRSVGGSLSLLDMGRGVSIDNTLWSI